MKIILTPSLIIFLDPFQLIVRDESKHEEVKKKKEERKEDWKERQEKKGFFKGIWFK